MCRLQLLMSSFESIAELLVMWCLWLFTLLVFITTKCMIINQLPTVNRRQWICEAKSKLGTLYRLFVWTNTQIVFLVNRRYFPSVKECAAYLECSCTRVREMFPFRPSNITLQEWKSSVMTYHVAEHLPAEHTLVGFSLSWLQTTGEAQDSQLDVHTTNTSSDSKECDWGQIWCS